MSEDSSRPAFLAMAGTPAGLVNEIGDSTGVPLESRALRNKGSMNRRAVLFDFLLEPALRAAP